MYISALVTLILNICFLWGILLVKVEKISFSMPFLKINKQNLHMYEHSSWRYNQQICNFPSQSAQIGLNIHIEPFGDMYLCYEHV